jgi:tRNA dimethylallyltransferase
MPARRVIALVGPTGCGKTAVSEWLAPRLAAEIVCADSRQVYRDLEVGTGKPTTAQRDAWPHHLFDALGVGERATAGWYGRAARQAIAAIHARGNHALLVGGSGLYLEAGRAGLFAEPPLDEAVRASVRAEMESRGPQAMHAELARLDATAAGRIAPRDRQRISRALEIHRSSGRSMSEWLASSRAARGAGSDWIWWGLEVPVPLLDHRIGLRSAWMFEHGLIEETAALVEAGKGDALRAMRAIGYAQALEVVEGRSSREAAVNQTTLRTRQLAKRQRTWFRHRAPVEWLVADDGDSPQRLAEELQARLTSSIT